jgi:hypothetical protein
LVYVPEDCIHAAAPRASNLLSGSSAHPRIFSTSALLYSLYSVRYVDDRRSKPQLSHYLRSGKSGRTKRCEGRASKLGRFLGQLTISNLDTSQPSPVSAIAAIILEAFIRRSDTAAFV